MSTGGDPLGLREYAFLVDGGLSPKLLARAGVLGERWGVAPHAVLIALGWLPENAYVRALAQHLGVPVCDPGDMTVQPNRFGSWRDAGAPLASAVDRRRRPPLAANSRATLSRSVAPHSGGHADARGGMLAVFDATSDRPKALARRIGASAGGWGASALTGRKTLETVLQAQQQQRLLQRATWGLHRLAPGYSAASQITARQAVRTGTFTGLLIGSITVAPQAAVLAWTMALTIPFVLVVALRLLAFLMLYWPTGSRSRGRAPVADDSGLPVYSLLVPLYREANMLPHLVKALRRIDYPLAKLDIRIVLEASDTETRAAAQALDLPGFISIVVVPDGQPRTKPKALNYALQFARGDLVTIYDAEDAPEPDQLRKAVAAFREQHPKTACLQAQLNIHNRGDGWLTRQFTLEYCALFDGLLPCLARLGLPLPLGGTSNHFRRQALAECGGWDPFNVTEDADLGLRLHRMGWRTGVIASTTYEEAPSRFSAWLPQRTRWLKGWMQTYLVHTRGLDAATPGPPLPRRRFSTAIGVHVVLGGLLLSVLVHPLVYVLLMAELISGRLFARPDSLMGEGFWHLAIANFVIGFLASLLLGAVTAWRRGYRALAVRAIWMPLYWILISIAGYRALWQLMRDPYRWEKTTHHVHPSARD